MHFHLELSADPRIQTFDFFKNIREYAYPGMKILKSEVSIQLHVGGLININLLLPSPTGATCLMKGKQLKYKE